LKHLAEVPKTFQKLGASGLILAKNSYEVTITTGRALAFLVLTPIQ